MRTSKTVSLDQTARTSSPGPFTRAAARVVQPSRFRQPAKTDQASGAGDPLHAPRGGDLDALARSPSMPDFASTRIRQSARPEVVSWSLGRGMAQAAGPIQAKELPDVPPVQMQAVVEHASSIWAARAVRARPVASDGPGQRMPQAVQAKMERSFGVDFSSVRIHEGPQASAIGAAAYTQGTNIHFAERQYDPHSQSGQELLGHELAHVVQQSQGRVRAPVQAKGGVAVNSDPALEDEADAHGARAAQGEPAGGAGPKREPTKEELDQLYPPETVIPVSLSAFTSAVIQPAYIARRPLARSWIPMYARLYHEHIFFEDGGQPPNIGFMGPQGLGQDTIDDYKTTQTGLDDKLMRQAVAKVGDPGKYKLFGNNCQDYVAQVLAQYHELKKKQ